MPWEIGLNRGAIGAKAHEQRLPFFANIAEFAIAIWSKGWCVHLEFDIFDIVDIAFDVIVGQFASTIGAA